LGNLRSLYWLPGEFNALPYSKICYEYGWVSRELEIGPSVTQIRYDKHTTTYFCVNYPASARELLIR
jgi:hypothetical protein